MDAKEKVFQSKCTALAGLLVTAEGLDEETVRSGPFIDFLMQLLQQLLPMLLACLPIVARTKPADVLKAMQTLTPIRRWMLRVAIYRACIDQEGQLLLAAPLYRQILTVAKTTTEAEVTAMMN